MGVKIVTLYEKYACSHCGKVYKTTSRDLNFVLATERIYIGPSHKKCHNCGLIRENKPYSEYKQKNIVERVLLRLGFFSKYKLTESILTLVEMIKESYENCSNMWDFFISTIAILFVFLILLISTLLGIYVWVIFSLLLSPIGLIVNNIKISKSISRCK